MTDSVPADGRPGNGSEGPAAVRWTALLVSVAGLLVAGYLTYEHFTTASTLACPDTGAVNCVKVTTSSYARFFGAPVAVLGLAYFAVMTVLCRPRLWQGDRPLLERGRLALSGLGVVFVIYLIWAELFRIDALCLWCTAVHALTVALFGALAVHHALRGPGAAAAEE